MITLTDGQARWTAVAICYLLDDNVLAKDSLVWKYLCEAYREITGRDYVSS